MNISNDNKPVADLLVVDDTPANLKLLSDLLRDNGYEVRAALNGELALVAVLKRLPDLILLDIKMPGMSGFEVCAELKRQPATRDIPVIFISALDNREDKVRAFETGGVDYINKPFEAVEVLARIRTHLTLAQTTRELERQVAERTVELERQIRNNALILNSAGEGIFGLDQDGILTFVNPAAAKLLGYSTEELVGHSGHQFWSCQHPDSTAHSEEGCPIYKTLEDGGDHTGEEWFIRKGGAIFPVNFTSSPIIEEGKLCGAVVSFMDVSDRFHLESIKKNIAKGTASVVGEAFLSELVENLATALGVRYAFVGKITPDQKGVTTMAVWSGDKRGENFQFQLAKTPYEKAVGQELCSYTDHVQQQFPEDERLVAMEAESCVCIPLFNNSGEPQGILTVLDDKPLADESMVRSMVALFGSRAGAELERIELDRKLDMALQQTIQSIANTVERRDPYTAGHQQRVAELAVAIAEEMGLDEERIKGIWLGGLIHDLGKINIPVEILNRPGRLNDMEFAIIKGHPTVGYEIIENVEFPWPIANMVHQHHERMDGSGYPQNLKDEGIILEARIMAVADVLEAINSHRPYRPGLGMEVAIEEIIKGRGELFDAEIVDACVRLIREKGFSWK